MSDTANAFRAGLVIVAGSIIATAFILASQKSSLDERNSVPYYALLTDAAGINAKSLITVAGLQVGEIKNISLVGTTVGELVPDIELRALDHMSFPPATPELRIPVSEDFDALITSLMQQGKLPSREEVERKKLTRDEALAAIVRVKGEKIRVARVDFSVTNTVQIPVDTWMKKESLGVLGAKALFLELGPSSAMLKSGDRLVNVRSMTGTDALLAQAQSIVGDVRSITNKLDKDIGGITADIKGITGELNRFVNGDGTTMPLDELYRLVVGDLRKLSNTVELAVRDANQLIKDNDGQIGKLLANVQSITADIAELTGKGSGGEPGPDGGPAGEGDIRATMSSVRKVADDLSHVTQQLRTMLGENEEQVGEGIKSLQVTITELNRSLASLSEVAGRVERGEGTVGRLLTDEKIADKVEAAVSGASDFVSSLTSLETHVDIGSWYNFAREANTTTLGLKLQPRPDKFYLVELVDDGGRLERFVDTDRDGTVVRQSVREEDNQLRISAMFAKQFFDFLVLRVGLIETTGGVGANVYLFERRVELRTDLFDFRGPRDSLATDVLPELYLPRWRTLIKAQPIPYMYVSAGVDDVLNMVGPSGLRTYTDQTGYGFDYFLGVGLTFKDEDLRSILPFIPGG